jgi:biopolymer transport protein ExbD
MAMTPTPTQAARVDMNVTPLIDVLLVLLVIFMIVTPLRSVGLSAQVPQLPGDPPESVRSQNPLVIEIGPTLAVTLNAQPVALDLLGARLAEVLRLRADRSVFVSAAPDVEFRHVATAIDVAKGAGGERVGLLPSPAR